MAEKGERLIYLAAPLFSQVQRRWNRALASAVEKAVPRVKVFLPQDIKVGGKFNDRRHFGSVFRSLIERLGASDAVLAVLDGPDSDSGACFEMGYAYAKGIPVVGVRTDFRQSQERGVNLMCSRACSEFVCRMSFDEDLKALAEDVAVRLSKVLTT